MPRDNSLLLGLVASRVFHFGVNRSGNGVSEERGNPGLFPQGVKGRSSSHARGVTILKSRLRRMVLDRSGRIGEAILLLDKGAPILYNQANFRLREVYAH